MGEEEGGGGGGGVSGVCVGAAAATSSRRGDARLLLTRASCATSQCAQTHLLRLGGWPQRHPRTLARCKRRDVAVRLHSTRHTVLQLSGNWAATENARDGLQARRLARC